jgi:16S rRNA (guanine527-N7)-methyltransferase
VLAADVRERLGTALERSRARGLLGPGPVEPHIDHALALATAIDAAPARLLDLGSGGGIPGLPLALAWPETEVALVEARQRAAENLGELVGELGLDGRCRVLLGRAEELGRMPNLRGRFDLVVARGFGPPPVTAECGAPFLRPGGSLVVTEPPGDQDAARWPEAGLAQLGLAELKRIRVGEMSAAVLTLAVPVDDRWPRRPGIPRKRPLWGVGPTSES